NRHEDAAAFTIATGYGSASQELEGGEAASRAFATRSEAISGESVHVTAQLAGAPALTLVEEVPALSCGWAGIARQMSGAAEQSSGPRPLVLVPGRCPSEHGRLGSSATERPVGDLIGGTGRSAVEPRPGLHGAGGNLDATGGESLGSGLARRDLTDRNRAVLAGDRDLGRHVGVVLRRGDQDHVSRHAPRRDGASHR